MKHTNGYRKYIVGILTTLILSLAAWGGVTLVSSGERISKLEARQQLIENWLTRVEEKLDWALGRRGN